MADYVLKRILTFALAAVITHYVKRYLNRWAEKKS